MQPRVLVITGIFKFLFNLPPLLIRALMAGWCALAPSVYVKRSSEMGNDY
jgi:hypothetical protein